MKISAKTVFFLPLLFIFLACNSDSNEPDVFLVIRGDDMGFSKAANDACIEAYKTGILTSTEVIVPGPYFEEAAQLLRDNPGLDVGVHLTLTAEWENLKWGPVTGSADVANASGDFPPSTEEFLLLNAPLDDVEAELRKQIELCLEKIPHTSHLSYHMGTPLANGALTDIVEKLSAEFNLPMGPAGNTQYLSMWGEPYENKETYFMNMLKGLDPGMYVFVCHPAFDNEETQGIIGAGADANVHMAEHRQTIKNILCSENAKKEIKANNIQLISYKDTY